MKRALSVLVLSVMAVVAHAQFAAPDGGDLVRGSLPDHWQTGGPKCMEIPDWQVHEYNPNLFILRQSGCTDYEMPFLYLFFGADKALLWDTGSRNGNLPPTLQRVVHQWLERNHRTSIPLIVTHSHSHEDHVWGDAGVRALNDPAMPVIYIAPTIEAASKFFGIVQWPTSLGQVDLGHRVLNIVPVPGHDKYAIALYDRQTGIVLTGDNLYPGRLYIPDFAAYKTSTERLIAFLRGKPVAHVLGNHIEETSTPFLDFPIGSIYHPHEHVLQLSYGSLLEVEDALVGMEKAPHKEAHRDFTIWVREPGKRDTSLRETLKKTQAEQLAHKWNQPE